MRSWGQGFPSSSVRGSLHQACGVLPALCLPWEARGAAALALRPCYEACVCGSAGEGKVLLLASLGGG